MRTVVDILVSAEIESKNISDLKEKVDVLVSEIEDLVNKLNHSIEDVKVTNEY